jgi:hypothetical protein
MPAPPFPPGAKLPAVIEHAGQHPLAWLDDVVTAGMRAWAATREAPALLIEVDPAVGLTRDVIDRCLAWAAAAGTTRVPAVTLRGRPPRSRTSHQLRPGRSNRLIRMEGIPTTAASLKVL